MATFLYRITNSSSGVTIAAGSEQEALDYYKKFNKSVKPKNIKIVEESEPWSDYKKAYEQLKNGTYLGSVYAEIPFGHIGVYNKETDNTITLFNKTTKPKLSNNTLLNSLKGVIT